MLKNLHFAPDISSLKIKYVKDLYNKVNIFEYERIN